MVSGKAVIIPNKADVQCAMNAERSQPCRLRGSLMRCCMRDEGFVAPRSRPAGGGFKPPHAALAEDRRGERCGKGAHDASGGDRKDGAQSPILGIAVDVS